ncbi:arylsulfotransferase family protein [Flagellimonas allohymeniacidonis]|uniref:Arylsulfotransferase (ASST) n=1 Tax=Flagellimonas allohymeniacidonis TaxID=2517819 RepID=A0A4Q8QFE5_9FLAO|nr:arylsulfotransferase family protein [Allomuricauda hymeniacidonis]TAI48584.1 hypothetical protein EW142_01920 [Allomuricauda hymeniacidonis]
MKKLRYAFIIIVGLFFFSVILSSSVRNVYLSEDGGASRLGFLTTPIKFMAEIPSNFKKILSKPEFFVSNAEAKDGFNYLKKPNSNEYPKVLVSYKAEKFGQTFDLLDINTGNLLKKWSPDNQSLYLKAYNEKNPERPARDSDLYFMHAYMDSDSSLYFTAQLTSLLAKIDKNSELVWLKNDQVYHHTIEGDLEDNLYLCTRPFISKEYDFLPGEHDAYKTTLMDDHITIINKNTGEESFSKSVIQILVDNGYLDMLLYKGQTISDPIHLNDVQPALYDSDHWRKGDLLVSCRNISVVFLYRPETNKIIWLQHGPWYNQHDADFYGDDGIVVFGNDIIREESRVDPRLTTTNLSFSKARPNNQAYLYSFSKDSISTPYAQLFEKEKIRTITSGRCDILPNGDIFVEETNNGRIIIGDSLNKKIEYVKRLDKENVSSLFWSRIIN